MEELYIGPYICTECGDEVDPGLRNAIDHFCECKKNAPNENISTHRYIEEMKLIDKERGDKINSVYPKMTSEEQWQLAILGMSGIVDYEKKVVMMGSASMIALIVFEEEMIKKYGKL